MAGGSCGSSGGGCGSGGCGSSGGGPRNPFFRFRVREGSPLERLAKLPRPLRAFALITPFLIIGNSVRFVRQHYIPDASLLPRGVEGEAPLPAVDGAALPPAPSSAATGRTVFGQRTVPVVDAATGSVVGYRFAQ